MNTLAQLLLRHLDVAAPYAVPESTLSNQLRAMVRPVATEEQWQEAVLLLLRRELIGFIADEVTGEKKFFIREAGQTALRRT